MSSTYSASMMVCINVILQDDCCVKALFWFFGILCDLHPIMCSMYYSPIQQQCVTTLHPTDVWFSPDITGERPPPCADFSLTSIDNRRAVMFGGWNNEQGTMNHMYIIDNLGMVGPLHVYSSNVCMGCSKIYWPCT